MSSSRASSRVLLALLVAAGTAWATQHASAAGDLSRVAGSNRIATAIETCRRLHPAADSAGGVIIARSDQFPDALTAASVAGLLRACVLLTPGGVALDTSVRAEVDRVLPTGAPVVIVGGSAALPATVDSSLAGYSVERLAGADRYATAKLIKERGDQLRGTAATSVIIASGENFPDALAASSYAALSGTPILLVKKSSTPVYTSSALSSVIKSAFVVGGTAAVSESVATDVESLIGNIAQRIAGADRYATAVAVADFFFAAPAAITVATGSNFPDALAGGPLAGTTPLSASGTPLLLTKPTSVPPALSAYLSQHASTIDDATSGYVLGGTNAVSAATEDVIEKLI